MIGAQRVLSRIGASHTAEREEHDFYATHPDAVRALLDREKFSGDIWENCAGQGHVSEVLKEYGYNVISTDLINRGYCVRRCGLLPVHRNACPEYCH